MKNELEKKVALASEKPFLSSSFRFNNLYGINENPGPGAYHKPEDQLEVIMEGEKEDKQAHYFKSKSRRNVFNNRNHRK
jgi:hypothetical protein